MTRTGLLFFGVTAALALLAAAPAQALQSRSYVSGAGSGTACTQAAPCSSIGNAVAATVSGGEINCVDSAIIGGGTIDRSLTIDCAGTAASSTALQVQGAGIIVRIRNLSINGGNFYDIPGIDFVDGAALIVENCLIENFTSAAAVGIRFRPIASGSRLMVTDSQLSNNGSGSTGGGIVVNPQSGGTAQVVLKRVSVSKNVFGIAADGTGSSGGINMTIADSVMSDNSQDAIVATTPSGGAPIGVLVTNSISANNRFGIRSLGPGVTVRVKNSEITGNGTGVAAGSGGLLLSGGGNTVQGNGTNGTFSGTYALQ
ncbi:hypothetical protein JQ604_35225 [Bradyrhizobium jicamae]|uniref:hypothetical protein n=1 Tax=Bradyrhizobium jicamae TaxID=280332 RepID=UPI001BA7C400|nr:hypothetical protein [Bradyrhizobium jicamae]MBR0757463.1 hypothetical protein [Bradyrhizobium jicamae]